MMMCEITEFAIGEFDIHQLRGGGVYAFLDEDGVVLYIGETYSFAKRIGEQANETPSKEHRPIPIQEIDRMIILEEENNRENRMYLEEKWIALYKPKYNKANAPYHMAHKHGDPKINPHNKRKLKREHPHRPPQIEDYRNYDEEELRLILGYQPPNDD